MIKKRTFNFENQFNFNSITIYFLNRITVKLNVNHSLDTAENVDEAVADAEKQAPSQVNSFFCLIIIQLN